jgi:hypothetical protein
VSAARGLSQPVAADVLDAAQDAFPDDLHLIALVSIAVLVVTAGLSTGFLRGSVVVCWTVSQARHVSP